MGYQRANDRDNVKDDEKNSVGGNISINSCLIVALSLLIVISQGGPVVAELRPHALSPARGGPHGIR